MIDLVCFDLETTGVDPETDRIVSAALVRLDPQGQVLEQRTWLVNPGIFIPIEATEIHGITNAEALRDGMPASAAALDIANELLQWHVTGGTPLVVYNAPYDLTLLDRELRRYWTEGLEATVNIGPVLDPMVIDKAVDRYRKGKRTLTAVAEVHGVPFEGDAHGSLADAITAGRLAQRMLSYPALNGTPQQIHDRTVVDSRDQAASFADYLHSQGNHERAAEVTGDWPIRPWAGSA